MEEYFTYTYDDLFNPLIQAIKALGGSASISEMEEEIAQILNLSEEAKNELHRESSTKLNYRLGWTRNYLKRYGVIENSSHGIWTLTEIGKKIESVDKEEVKRYVRQQGEKSFQDNHDFIEVCSWQDNLIKIIKEIEPNQFERLCQRLLRELGFVNVEVTGRTNDGGIDGKGIYKIGSVISFHVVFQSKRYQGSVSSSVIRDFRGAMSGRADKGLILTTGNFTAEAKKEATRDGAIPIDLIDGNEFADRLKELNLGVNTELVEEVTINPDFFKKI